MIFNRLHRSSPFQSLITTLAKGFSLASAGQEKDF
jgi:hypothetical protein